MTACATVILAAPQDVCIHLAARAPNLHDGKTLSSSLWRVVLTRLDTTRHVQMLCLVSPTQFLAT